MDILLIEVMRIMCRSRIAQELLHTFGRGNEYFYGRSYGRKLRSRCRMQCDGAKRLAYRVKAFRCWTYAHRSWDYVVTLCKEAEEELSFLTLNAKQQVHFNFEDPFKNRFQSEGEQEQQIATLTGNNVSATVRVLSRWLSEQLLPRCTCGANTYCRCRIVFF